MDKIELKKSEAERLESVLKLIEGKKIELEVFSMGLNLALKSILENNGIKEVDGWGWDRASSFLFKKQSEVKVENQDGKTATDV